MKKIIGILLMVSLLMVVGCTPFRTPAACQNADSAILTVTQGNPTGLDRALLTVQVLTQESKKYQVEEIKKFIEDIRIEIDKGITYLQLLEYINVGVEDLRKSLGIATIIAGPELGKIAVIGGDNLISPCDWYLMNLHLDRQEQILAIYAMGN